MSQEAAWDLSHPHQAKGGTIITFYKKKVHLPNREQQAATTLKGLTDEDFQRFRLLHIDVLHDIINATDDVVAKLPNYDVLMEKINEIIYDYQTWIKKVCPGDKSLIIEREMRKNENNKDSDHKRAFKRYIKKETMKGDGTPIENINDISAIQVQKLKLYNIFTMEQLTHAPENVADDVDSFFSLKRRANDYLTRFKKSDAIEALKSSNDEKDKKLETLEEQLKIMNEQLQALTSASNQKKGRKSKPKTAEAVETVSQDKDIPNEPKGIDSIGSKAELHSST